MELFFSNDLHPIPIIGTFVKTIDTMSKNTSISLGDHFESFISNKIESGRYQSASEIIRAGLRLLEHEERKIEALKSALELGETSGIVQDFSAPEHLESIHAKRL
ncbi:MAG: type II toxin-antitoxin system ParD family antitoxin [Bacteroidales bacterium]|nr:type II toxin-antitoxin system ParD family antitoxin [Bacteroidales bacterium]